MIAQRNVNIPATEVVTSVVLMHRFTMSLRLILSIGNNISSLRKSANKQCKYLRKNAMQKQLDPISMTYTERKNNESRESPNIITPVSMVARRKREKAVDLKPTCRKWKRCVFRTLVKKNKYEIYDARGWTIPFKMVDT